MSERLADELRIVADHIEELSEIMLVNVEPTKSQCLALLRLALELRRIIITH